MNTLSELPQHRPPVYVCPACGFLSSERLLFCAQCGKRLLGVDEPRAADDPVKERKRVRILYAWLTVWVVLLGGAVFYTVGYDPTQGHMGHIVYSDEFILEAAGGDGISRLMPGGQAFRISKSDRIERMANVPTRSQANAWIRVTSGPHAGRSGVMTW